MLNFVIFLDFLSTKQGLPVVNFCVSRSSDRDTFVPRAGYITARDQSMVQSGVSLKLETQRVSKLSQKRNSRLWTKKMQII